MHSTFTRLLVFTSFLRFSFTAAAQVSTCTAPLAGDTNCYQTSRPNQGNPLTNWPPLPHQDCCNAVGLTNPLLLINNGVLVPAGATTSNKYPGCVADELPADANTCFSNNEKATVWYKFKVGPLPGGPSAIGAPAGKLRFKVIPLDALDDPDYDPATDNGAINFGNTDLDFLLFNVTPTYYTPAGACASIKNSSAYGTPNTVISRCNWTGTKGPTGLFEPGTGLDAAVSPAVRFNKPLHVKVGDIFYLAIDNFSINTQGYYLDFQGIEAPDDSTAVLYSPDGNPTAANLLSGKVFQNVNNDCTPDLNEAVFKNRMVTATPGPYFAFTNKDGRYTFYTDSGHYSVKQNQGHFPGLIETQTCPPNLGGHTVHFPASSGDTSEVNHFANNVQQCHFLTIEVSSARRRRCWRSSTMIKACNIGFAASPAGTTVRVRYPAHIRLLSASSPYTYSSADSSYVFQVGAMAANSCNTITTVDSVLCVPGITGKQQCVNARIDPTNTCTIATPNWDGSDLHVTNACGSTVPIFTIKNTGTAMAQARQYKVYVDGQLSFAQFIALGAGDSTVFQVVPTQPGVIRVEIAQAPHHPYSTFSASENNCLAGGPITVPYSNPDEDPIVAISCGVIRDSYDPNEKQVSPAGVGPQGFVLPQRSFEYQIHFQNTGNDTAYQVVLVDTLDRNLNPATLEEIGSSHPYQLYVTGKGRPVLKFMFNNILLTDSARDPIRSTGYATFRIRPYDTLALGTQIRNRAYIYFDFNSPIRTNTVLNTLFDPVLNPNLIDTVLVLGSKGNVQKPLGMFAYPNPNEGLFSLQATEASVVRVLSVTGKELSRFTVTQKEQPLDLRVYGKGIYILDCTSASQRKTLKLVVH